MTDFSKLEKIIGYEFVDKALVERAFSHSSYANEKYGSPAYCNERLEFLGDAVLEVSVSKWLFRQFPKLQEGPLSKMRASLVCERSLWLAGKALGLNEFLLLGKGEEQGQGKDKPSLVADAMEALIAAIYLDGGSREAERFIELLMTHHYEDAKAGIFIKDAKSTLQELLQAKGEVHISYRLISESGPDHAKTFVSAVYLDEEEMGRGTGHKKQDAESAAAEDALRRLKR